MDVKEQTSKQELIKCSAKKKSAGRHKAYLAHCELADKAILMIFWYHKHTDLHISFSFSFSFSFISVLIGGTIIVVKKLSQIEYLNFDMRLNLLIGAMII